MTLANLGAVQQALGVELPESYVAVVEDFALASVREYKFYPLDELCWFSDHPLARAIPYEGRALVIGEDLIGNAVVLLGFDVAGKPALSDEVYLIDHDFGEPEELAMDLMELLEGLGGVAPAPPETIWETAFEVSATRQKTIDALTAALVARGYTDSADDWDGGGAYLRLSVMGTGPVVVWVRTEESSLWLARRLAVALERPIKASEVVLRDVAIKDEEGNDDDFGYPYKARRLDVKPDGTMADRETGLTKEVANMGDPYETAMGLLWKITKHQPDDDPQALEFFRAAPPADLSPRLAVLLTAISESDAVDLTEIAGQTAVRIELPDGTRQMSVVSEVELARLREHVDI